MDNKQFVYQKLEEANISYQSVEHEAVFTIAEMQELDFPQGSKIAKNLFLRDAKGKRHFLVVTEATQKIDLSELSAKLGASKLSFASDERLSKYLGLSKGAVSPFGLLNDADKKVEFFLDTSLQGCEFIGIHPNDNTATVFLSEADLVSFLSSLGHKVNPLRF